MLNTQLIGSYISKLRKRNDLTQVELAEKLNVSHQAVSKWEKGDSIPDVGTLIALSEEFNCSVDAILNGGEEDSTLKNIGALVHKVAAEQSDEAAELLNNGETDMEGLVSIAPVLKSSSIGKITRNLDEISWEYVTRLAPFLDEETLELLFQKISTDDAYSWDHIVQLAPFLNRDSLLQLIMDQKESISIDQIARLAPFLGRSRVDEIINQTPVEDIPTKLLVRLAPFVSRELLHGLLDKLTDELSLEKFLALVPFLGRETVDKLLKEQDITKIDSKRLTRLAPFASREVIGEIASTLEIDDASLLRLAPFLDRETLGAMVGKADLENISPSAIAQLAPFLDKEALANLIRTIAK
ncbi:helix-turn-helix domain-containing protein [Ornithinibacillus contaminans]|uniref:helix-turn-helix domain-containing protein n=1 Tax=Ornithinibacillus contaminans TaxID=694055 RepID=UPI00069D0881|nr:helix-turn-helix transcriptional regulator [Ornithinibacillus contaminans]